MNPRPGTNYSEFRTRVNLSRNNSAQSQPLTFAGISPTDDHLE
jgi:hypothetical protein